MLERRGYTLGISHKWAMASPALLGWGRLHSVFAAKPRTALQSARQFNCPLGHACAGSMVAHPVSPPRRALGSSHRDTACSNTSSLFTMATMTSKGHVALTGNNRTAQQSTTKRWTAATRQPVVTRDDFSNDFSNDDMRRSALMTTTTTRQTPSEEGVDDNEDDDKRRGDFKLFGEALNRTTNPLLGFPALSSHAGFRTLASLCTCWPLAWPRLFSPSHSALPTTCRSPSPPPPPATQ